MKKRTGNLGREFLETMIAKRIIVETVVKLDVLDYMAAGVVVMGWRNE